MITSASTPGFSDVAEFIRKRTTEPIRHMQESSAFGSMGVVREELADVWEECRYPNWDGYDAVPVTQDSLRNTYVFLELLPPGFSRPSVGAEPDGHLTLEWCTAPRRMLSVSVSPSNELHYAALLGPNRTCGTELFYDEIPQLVLDLIRKVSR